MASFELGKQMGAVHCFNCGDVALTDEEYDEQMCNPDSLWECPLCGEQASWNDENYDLYLDEHYDKG
jgi:endogenous inhibitor of DNA gyrase (YacG/DUF329 family)